MVIKIEVFSHYIFEEQCKKDGLNDGNVEQEKNKAFIDIIGTQECLKYYLDEVDTKHFFSDNHENVLNLDFDDISTDVNYDGHIFKTMRMEQAEKAVGFIEHMIDKGVTYFRICCRAGYSRSRAIGEWICRYCQDKGINIEYEDRNDYTTTLNPMVLRKLNHAYWKKHGMNCYSNGEDYEEDLIHPEIIKVQP